MTDSKWFPSPNAEIIFELHNKHYIQNRKPATNLRIRKGSWVCVKGQNQVFEARAIRGPFERKKKYFLHLGGDKVEVLPYKVLVGWNEKVFWTLMGNLHVDYFDVKRNKTISNPTYLDGTKYLNNRPAKHKNRSWM